ncbi:MAG TPA: hypothetical protein VE642_06340 [Pyrinomonadaceae bacterium]|jgi:hypothetical protein|nr:hypothetical protein [Pyrinomonadaceae bacterium]
MRAATVKESSAGAAGDAATEARPASVESLVAEVKGRMRGEWPPAIYRDRVLAMRTRSHKVPAATRNAAVEVQHTLLGIELKVGRRRISCPDFATARYLSVFARAGVSEVAVPYDITKISSLADELESAWQRVLLLAEHLTRGRAASFRTRVRTALAREAGREIEEAGAGAPMPQFRQTTRQRPQRI